MIRITDKTQCCGCSACEQICPKQSIKLSEDEMGFLYPVVSKSTCVECGLCEKICPVINKWEEKTPIEVSACKNNNEQQRKASSSGGVFVLLAEQTIKQGGVVFGARFDKDWSVIHSYVERIEDLHVFQGSKYVQSRIGESYKHAEAFLKQNRKVLFSGTPCQIAGLNHYLRKEYENLLTIEVICHGVPSPRVWRDYLTTIRRPKKASTGENAILSSLNEMSSIEGISFRDKQNGWRKYAFVVRYSADQREAEKNGLSSVSAYNQEIREYHRDNLFMKGFLNNLYLRPSCFHCVAKGARSCADISIGDFWNIGQYIKKYDDDKGVTLVYINSKKGKDCFAQVHCDKYELGPSMHYNHMFYQSTAEKYPIEKFLALYKERGVEAILPICQTLRPSRRVGIFGEMKKRIKKVLKHITQKH